MAELEKLCCTDSRVEALRKINAIIENGGGGTLNMFDTVLKDHILTYEESKGLALQGTYIYKEAIAGSRYGYPTFYEKCVEEFQDASNTKVWLKSNVTNVGSVVDTNGILSNLSTGNYAKSDIAVNLGAASSWEIVTKHNITSVGSINDGFAGILGGAYNLNYYLNAENKIVIELSSNGTSYDIGSIRMLQAVPLNTEFYIKAEFTGSAYNLYYGTTLEGLALQGSIASSVSVSSRTNNFALGVDESGNHTKWVGTIDLKDCYININGVRAWSGSVVTLKNTNKHFFYDINDKEAVDEYFTSTGRAWFYGVDTENERIFLPRNNSYFRIGDESTVGTNQDAGLPNIDGYFINDSGGNTGAFYNAGGVSGNINAAGEGTTDAKIAFDASRCSKVYGNAVDTVELDSVNMLLYICVGNTESEEALTNVTEITTSENDTLPWGYHFYSGELLEAPIGYIESLGQWNDGTGLYAQFYSKAVNKLGEAFAGGYIKEVTEEYDDYDLVINQTDITFRLPLLDGKRVLVAKKEPTNNDTTWYNLYSDGWCEQGGFINALANNATSTITLPFAYNDVSYNVAIAQTFSTAYLYEPRHAVVLYQNKTNSSFQVHNTRFAGETLAGISCYWNTKGYTKIPTVNEYTEKVNLYFKVANAVQNLELLNAGEVLEAVNNVNAKVDTTPHIVETYVNGTSGYRIWSDGYCEQWGYLLPTSAAAVHTVTFLKPFKDTNYSILRTTVSAYDTTPSLRVLTTQALTTTNFKMYLPTPTYADGAMWRAYGYIA